MANHTNNHNSTETTYGTHTQPLCTIESHPDTE